MARVASASAWSACSKLIAERESRSAFACRSCGTTADCGASFAVPSLAIAESAAARAAFRSSCHFVPSSRTRSVSVPAVVRSSRKRAEISSPIVSMRAGRPVPGSAGAQDCMSSRIRPPSDSPK